MAENRVPMSEISQYLGHKSTLITERVYARYSPEYLGSAAESLEIFKKGVQLDTRSQTIFQLSH